LPERIPYVTYSPIILSNAVRVGLNVSESLKHDTFYAPLPTLEEYFGKYKEINLALRRLSLGGSLTERQYRGIVGGEFE